MLTLSRRGFIALGGAGAAGAVLATCGSEEDPRDEGRDGELLSSALAAESTLVGAYESALGEAADADRRLFESCRDGAQQRLGELEALAGEARATVPDELEAEPTGATGAVAAADLAIRAYREAAGLLSTTELRFSATSFLAGVAAEQAAVRAGGGDEPLAPEPFVTGLPEPPLTAPDAAATEDE